MPPRRKTYVARARQASDPGRRCAPVAGEVVRPEDGGTKYLVMFRAPGGEGEPWKRVLRRANSEAEARKIFTQADAALDTETEKPPGADVRAARTIRMLGEAYLKDSIERGTQLRTMEQRETRLNAHTLPSIGDVQSRSGGANTPTGTNCNNVTVDACIRVTSIACLPCLLTRQSCNSPPCPKASGSNASRAASAPGILLFPW